MSAPATRPCINCGVRIHARAERCVLCGSEQPVGRRALSTLGRYLPPTLGVMLAAGLVAAAVAVSGSNTLDGSPQLFAVRSDPHLVTLVPQNWQGGGIVAPPHVTREVYLDPDRQVYSMTIEMRRHTPGSALDRAHVVLSQIRRSSDLQFNSFRRTVFPGGRPSWLIEYTRTGTPHAMYFYSACAPAVAMSVDVSAPTRAELAGALAQLPAATGPRC